MRTMTRVKVPTFTTGDIEFFQEYVNVMSHVAQALDKLQGEHQAYLGCLLPILAVTKMNLTLLKDEKFFTYCKPLVTVLIEAIEKRFGHLLEDQDCQLAAAFHPRFRLLWLDKCSPALVERVRQLMESVLEQALKEESTAPSSDTSGEELDEDDFFASITKQSSVSGGGSSSRSLKNKAQSLLITWLDGSSKNDLSDATFLGEPALVKLFVKYNTPIPSSAAVERMFSIGKEILRAKRCLLADSTFEKLMFMKGNVDFIQSLKSKK